MSTPNPAPIYQLRIRLDRISPLIWRRLLVTDATTIAELHAIIQVAFGWSDSHLHQFVIHGKHYGIAYLGGISFADNPDQVHLADFRFRTGERFTYEYIPGATRSASSRSGRRPQANDRAGCPGQAHDPGVYQRTHSTVPSIACARR